MEPINYYEDKAKRHFVNQSKKNNGDKLASSKNSTEQWKDTAKGVGTDLIVGVLGGGLIAASIGKPALIVGLAVSGYGHYTKNKMISALGLGIMASGTMSALNNKLAPLTLKERVQAFGEELKRKLYLDKLLPSKSEKLNGTDLPLSNETVNAPKASDFFRVQNLTQEMESENTTRADLTQNSQIESDYEDWDFNERIY